MRTLVIGWITAAFVLTAAATVSFAAPRAAEGSTPETAAVGGPYTVRVPLKGQQVIRAILERGMDVLSITKDGHAEVVAENDADLRFLQTLGVPIAVIRTPDMPLPASSALDANLGLYHTYAEMTAALWTLEQTYPALADTFSIGLSSQGRYIYAIKISDNVSVDEDEPEVLYMGNHHARELMSVDIPLRFAQYLLANYGTDADVTQMVNEREIYFIPMVNPDGHVYVEANHSGYSDYWWRKNRRRNFDGTYGVDLNRNYGYMWGYDNIGSSPVTSEDTYRGNGPFSEGETQRVRTFCQGREFILGLSFHTYGEWFLWPWGYTSALCPDNALFSALADSLAPAGYTAGPAAATLYVTNGDTDDWAYGETTEKPRMFLFTPEMNNSAQGGFGPADTYIQPTFDLMLQTNMDLLHFADNPRRIFPPSQVVQHAIDDTNYPLFTVNWAPILPPDPNPAVSYDVLEYHNPGWITRDGANEVSNFWTFDEFVVSTARAYEGTGSYYCGTPADNASRTLQMATFYRVTTATDSLLFKTWYDLELNYDYAYVEVSTNHGATWTTIPGNITTTDNPNGTNKGNGITGASSGWVSAIFPLTAYLGSEIDIRVHYVTDQGDHTQEGFYADWIGPVPAYESVTMAASATPDTFLIVTPQEVGTYTYHVRARDAENQIGPWSLSQSITIEDVTGIGDTPVLATRLGQNYPNPFNPTTRIPYTVGARAGTGRPVAVSLAIYNVAGELVATLVDKPLSPGRYEAVWMGSSDRGAAVASGVYFARLSVGSESALTRKIVLLK
jgi:carboxypeptidase T